MRQIVYFILFLGLSFYSCSKDNSDVYSGSESQPLTYNAALAAYSQVTETRYYTPKVDYEVPADGEDTLILRDLTKISEEGELQNLGLLIMPSARLTDYNVLFTTNDEKIYRFGWENNIFSHQMSTYKPSFANSKWDALSTKFNTYLYDIDPSQNDSVYILGVSEGHKDVVFGAGKRMETFYNMSVHHVGSKLCVVLYDGAAVTPTPFTIALRNPMKVWLVNMKKRQPCLTFHKNSGNYQYVVPTTYESGLSCLPNKNLLSGASAVTCGWYSTGESIDSIPIPYKNFKNIKGYVILLPAYDDLSGMALKVTIPKDRTLDNAVEQTYTLPLDQIELENGGGTLTSIDQNQLIHLKVYVSLVEGVKGKAEVLSWSQASVSTDLELSGTDSTFVSK